MSFEIDSLHRHYTLLSIDGHNNISNVNCPILPIETMSLHTQHGPMSKNAHVHEDKLQYGITLMTKDINNRVNVRRLKQLARLQTKKYKTLCKQKSHNKHNCLSKKNPITIYLANIEDTPEKKCPIYKQLQFHKNMERIGKDFEQIYVNLSTNHKNMPNKVICKVCKTTLRNGKLPQFVVPKNIK